MADGYIGLHTRRASGARAVVVTDSPYVERIGLQAGLVAGLRAFAKGHGGATAVIEYAGRKGAKIVLTGTDGTAGAEQYTDSTEAARAACAQAGVSIDGEWERELAEQTRGSGDLWAARSRRVMAR